MSELALHDASVGVPVAKPNLDQKPHVSVALVFILLLVSGIGYAAYGILTDTSSVGEPLALTALILLGIALMIANMYLVSDAIRLLPEAGAKFDATETASLKEYRGNLDAGTRFIPTWVKVSVAIALGLGTMIGWKRIVVTVGEARP